ncbi:MAG TPA: hypothetical protein VJP85_03300 [Candidatus Baltobacteraceae bacterium]|nr:hypothetical protein [Candidatus Baltobacteraceae bacterium]
MHVVDDGTRCRQTPDRFFASMNGDMIWNGMQLTGDHVRVFNDGVETFDRTGPAELFDAASERAQSRCTAGNSCVCKQYVSLRRRN